MTCASDSNAIDFHAIIEADHLDLLAGLRWRTPHEKGLGTRCSLPSASHAPGKIGGNFYVCDTR